MFSKLFSKKYFLKIATLENTFSKFLFQKKKTFSKLLSQKKHFQSYSQKNILKLFPQKIHFQIYFLKTAFSKNIKTHHQKKITLIL